MIFRDLHEFTEVHPLLSAKKRAGVNSSPLRPSLFVGSRIEMAY